jgi:hypothetical protein
MVAPDYADYRRAIAKQLEFGKIGTVQKSDSDEVSTVAAHLALQPPAEDSPVPDVIEQALKANLNAASFASKETGGSKRQAGPLADAVAEVPPVEIQKTSSTRTKLKAKVPRRDSGKVRAAKSISNASEVPRLPAMGVESTSRRLTLMEAVTRKRAVRALYNGALIKLAPHQIFERHGELFLAALNLSKSWRADEERRLGQFKFAGLTEVQLVDETIAPLPSYNGMLPRPDDTLILAI